MRKVYEVHAVLLAVDRFGQLALLAVVYDDLVVFAARYDVIAGGREVKAIDLVGVLAEHFGHLEAAHDVVHQLHRDGRVRILRERASSDQKSSQTIGRPETVKRVSTERRWAGRARC